MAYDHRLVHVELIFMAYGIATIRYSNRFYFDMPQFFKYLFFFVLRRLDLCLYISDSS